jgi:type II secretion system protein N
MSRRLQIVLFSLFAAVALVASLLLTFPYDVLGRRIEAEVAKAVPGASLSINEIGPALPFGLRMADVVFAKEGKDGEPGPKFTIDRIRLRPALFALLTGKLGLAYSVDVLAGSVRGQVVTGKDGLRLETILEGLQLDEGGAIERASGLQLLGGLSGRLDLVTDAKGQITDGNFAAIIAGGKMKGGKIMGFGLPPMDLGSPEFNVTIDKGEAKIAKADVKSPDVELALTGGASLRPDLLTSLVKGNVHLRLTDAFLSRNPTIKGMLGFAGPFRKPDGSIELPLNGPLARPLSIPGFGR